ncbi:hypothetical protein BST61_g10279 [Cercospora zeina]
MAYIPSDSDDEKTGHLAERDGSDQGSGHDSTPEVHFDPGAEKRLRRKIDMYIVPTVALLYLFCFIDRANIGNARLAGLEKDLQLRGYDYNFVLTTFYISYIVFEIPSNLACKYFGPGWFLPSISLAFGAASVACAFTHSKAQIAGVRFVLGMFEAGMLPGIAYYLSRWYRRKELAFRLALFGTVRSWRMIFAIEGVITIGISLIAFFTLTDRPATARWLTEDEKALAEARIRAERVGTTEVLDTIDAKKILLGIFNPVVLATSFIFLLDNITVQGLAFFAPTIVRTIYPGHTVVQQQLRTVPPYIVGAVAALVIPYCSGKTDRRVLYFVGSAPLMMIGYIMFLASTDGEVRYGAIFIIAIGAFTFGSLCNAQVSANVVTDTARSSAIGTNVMLGNVGGLISTWAFLPFDGPNYPIGNGLNLATSSTVLILSIALWFWIRWDNGKREREHRVPEQELEGLGRREIEDLDWKHPAFRWRE